jgi:hypothetical protein
LASKIAPLYPSPLKPLESHQRVSEKEILPMGQQYLNKKNLEIARELYAWAEKEYTTDNPLMTRPANAIPSRVVCPFLKASLDSDYLQLAFHPEVNAADPESIETLMNSYIKEFGRMRPYDPDETRKALLVVFPNIQDVDLTVLDQVHSVIKDKYVRAGLMIAQFHKKCKAVSVHNRGLLTQQSSYPLMAIRYMQHHDILFLKDKAEWFHSYSQRFGEHFKTTKEKPDYYFDLYHNAKRLHAGA